MGLLDRIFGWDGFGGAPAAAPAPLPPGPASRARVLEALSRIDDPELGVDIVRLGLVRRVDLDDGGVSVEMTVTSPVCPAGPWMADQARDLLAASFPEARPVEVRLVFHPPWSPAEMSAEARASLGFGA